MINFIEAHKYTLQFWVLFLVLIVSEAIGDITERSYIEQAITLGFDLIFSFILVALSYMNDTIKDKK